MLGLPRWKPVHVEFAAKCIDDPQHMLEPERGLACFQLDHEPQPHASGQSHLRLGEAKVFPSSPYGVPKALCGRDVNHEGGSLIAMFPIGKFLLVWPRSATK